MRALFRRYPGLSLPLVPLLAGPTPVRRLLALEELTGAASFHIKDDSCSAPPYGGNKPRKLEWLLGEARARGAREVIAIGADGSNYCLATAVHGTRAGFAVTLVVSPQPATDGVRRNLLAGAGTGASIIPTGGELTMSVAVARRVIRRRLRGERAYPTWFGGSSGLGAVGFVEAALELVEQIEREELPEPDVIVVPTGSTGTHAGLLLGLALVGRSIEVVGVRVTPAVMGNARVVAGTARRANEVLRAAGAGIPRVRIRAGDVVIRQDQYGDGYGLVTSQASDAMARLAEFGVTLDPTYSGKAMAGALAEDLRGRRVLFWSTYNGCPVDELAQGRPEDLPEPLRRRVFGG